MEHKIKLFKINSSFFFFFNRECLQTKFQSVYNDSNERRMSMKVINAILNNISASGFVFRYKYFLNESAICWKLRNSNGTTDREIKKIAFYLNRQIFEIYSKVYLKWYELEKNGEYYRRRIN